MSSAYLAWNWLSTTPSNRVWLRVSASFARRAAGAGVWRASTTSTAPAASRPITSVSATGRTGGVSSSTMSACSDSTSSNRPVRGVANSSVGLPTLGPALRKYIPAVRLESATGSWTYWRHSSSGRRSRSTSDTPAVLSVPSMRCDCGLRRSRSTSTTRGPAAASDSARFTHVEVLPSPCHALVTTTIGFARSEIATTRLERRTRNASRVVPQRPFFRLPLNSPRRRRAPLSKGDSSVVSWSADGRHLYARRWRYWHVAAERWQHAQHWQLEAPLDVFDRPE